MLILGIETSCDETAASVVKDGKVILSNIVASSLKEHSRFGGIIPEIASRRQMELINAVVATALEKAGKTLKDIDGIAVTESPGLIGSLLVGISYARALSFATKKPYTAVDHIKAHIYANFLSFKDTPQNPSPVLPAIGLIVSGGHSNLYYMKSPTDYKLLGNTRDDAAGEAFDKVARILGLGYPGGPVIDRLAKDGKKTSLKFPSAELAGSFDFSFSGVKTAVLHHYQREKEIAGQALNDVVFAFQESVVSILVKKSIDACKTKKAKTLLMGGGVAANSALRVALTEACSKEGIKLFFPPIALCLDNAAMIAGLGFHLLKK